MDAIANDEKESSTEIMKKIKKANENIKYQAFEKVKITSKIKSNLSIKKLNAAKSNLHNIQEKTKARDDEIDDIESKIGAQLCEAQIINVERELDEIRDASKKGKCAAVFKLKAKVTGEKKGRSRGNIN